ncbi:MAG: hypothetical protein JWR33_1780 [Naasia sp.]|jgi:hypothetical protein|uniref:hypothetical protein n=1 Tax=Naasia sp. TaxID=2546198 RepID=UPI00261E25AD|nr:hypothetical protein [Naasia sp.]MCU1571039.1 hypothetical protein [Naasia sp.]
MTPVSPSVEHILGTFFARRSIRATGLRLERIVNVANRLSDCIERGGSALLTSEERVLLELERQFCLHWPFHHAMKAPQLLPVLRLFVTDAWLPTNLQDRRVQLHTVAALVEFLEAQALVDGRRLLLPLLELKVAIDDAKAALH